MDTPQKNYLFRLTVDAPSKIQETFTPDGSKTYIRAVDTGQKVSGELSVIKEPKPSPKGQITRIIPYFIKQFKAIFIPFKNSRNLSKFRSISLVYAILSYGVNIGSFFVRGWRLGVVRNMSRRLPIMAPGIQSLQDVGTHLKEGIVLIGTKFIYDAPKYLFLVIFGYELIEFVLDFGYWIVKYNFSDESRFFIEYAKDEGIGS